MEEHEDNPYQSPKALPKAKKSRGAQWIVAIDGIDRTVILNHSKMGMAITIYIDDELVYKFGDMTTIISSVNIPLQYGDSELLIQIRDKFIGSEYSISVNGRLIHGFDFSAHTIESDYEKGQLHGAVFLVAVSPIMYFLFGTESYVGPIRGDIFSLFSFLLGAFGLVRHFVSAGKA